MTSKRETDAQVTYFMDQKVTVRDVVDWLDQCYPDARAADLAAGASFGELQKFIDRREGRPWPETQCYSVPKADSK